MSAYEAFSARRPNARPSHLAGTGVTSHVLSTNKKESGKTDEVQMSFLSEAQLEDEFGPFIAFQKAFGVIPNLLQAQTLLPRVIEAQAMLESAVRLREGAISRVQKERILLSIAADQRDTYCVALDSRVLSSHGLSDGQIGDLLNGRHAGRPAPAFASLQFCRKLSRHAPSVCRQDIEALRPCGLRDESIFEAVVVTA